MWTSLGLLRRLERESEEDLASAGGRYVLDVRSGDDPRLDPICGVGRPNRRQPGVQEPLKHNDPIGGCSHMA